MGVIHQARSARSLTADDAAALVRPGDWVGHGAVLAQPDPTAARVDQLSVVSIHAHVSQRPRAVLEAHPGRAHFAFYNWHMSGYDSKTSDALSIKVPKVVNAKPLLSDIITEAGPPPMVSQLVLRPPWFGEGGSAVDTAATLLPDRRRPSLRGGRPLRERRDTPERGAPVSSSRRARHDHAATVGQARIFERDRLTRAPL